MGSDTMDFNFLYFFMFFIDFCMALPTPNRSKTLAKHITPIDVLMGFDTMDLNCLYRFIVFSLISRCPNHYKIKAEHEQKHTKTIDKLMCQPKSIDAVLGHSLCVIVSDTMDLHFLYIFMIFHNFLYGHANTKSCKGCVSVG